MNPAPPVTSTRRAFEPVRGQALRALVAMIVDTFVPRLACQIHAYSHRYRLPCETARGR